MPVRIRRRRRARGVERGDLSRRQVPADGPEILPQLLLVARANDERRDRWALQQPVQRDLRHGLAGLGGHDVERIDDLVERLVLTGGP